MATGGGVAAKEELRYAEYLPPSTQRPNADIDHAAVSRRAPLDPRIFSFPSSSVQPTGAVSSGRDPHGIPGVPRDPGQPGGDLVGPGGGGAPWGKWLTLA